MRRLSGTPLSRRSPLPVRAGPDVRNLKRKLGNLIRHIHTCTRDREHCIRTAADSTAPDSTGDAHTVRALAPPSDHILGARGGTTPPPAQADSRMFAATSVWNSSIAADAMVDPDSAAMVGALAAEAADEYQQGVGPWIVTTGSGTVYQVGPDQPTVPVQLDNPTISWRVSLQSAFSAVPIPPDAEPSPGSDAEMTIWQPTTDKLWEFFEMRRESDGWHAAWGGAMDDVSRSPGYYTTTSWPGALAQWGATATSLPIAAGQITLREIQQGHIDHALAVDLPYPRAAEWSWPAQRSDGTGTDANAIPEGAQLRLDPNLNLASLHLPALTLMIAQAAQTYGIIVRDQTHHAIGFYAEDPTQSGTNPYYTNGVPNPTGPFGGLWPDQLLHSFPWSSLEVLQMKLEPSSSG